MNIKLISSIAFGVILIAGSAFFADIAPSLKKIEEKPSLPPVKRYVKTAAVRYTSVPTNVVAYGRVETAQTLDLIAEVSGRMNRGAVNFKEGSRFSRGTLLYLVDDQEVKLNLQAQKSNFLRDLATILPDLKIDFPEAYDKWKKYFDQLDVSGNFPEIPGSDSQKEKTFLATKNIYASYFTIKSAEVNLRKHRYYAPFDGSITTVNIQSGSFVNPGNNLGKIIKAGALELKVSVETSDIPWIIQNSLVRISSSEGNLTWEGTVTRIGDVVNPNTQSVDVFIKIHPNNYRLYDGQYLEAAIPAQTIENGMIIPRNAIFNDSEVFVLQDTLLKKREINILRINEETAVFNGLPAGEDVVIEPPVGAHNNMKAYKLDTKDIPTSNKPIGVSSVKVSSN